jgi:V8-like Glu-specific endopeptidase
MGKTWARKTLLAFLGLGLALGSNSAQAAIYDKNGNKIPDAEVNSSEVNWELLSAEQGRTYNGVGSLENQEKGFCTAFFLNTGGEGNAPAYAITNGHCYGISFFPTSKEIIVNRSSSMVLKFNYFVNEETRVRPVLVRRVVYATLKNTDIAILELDTTFKQLVREGFTPLNMDSVPPTVGEPVQVIGIPVSGVNPSLSFLHKVVCEVGDTVSIREDVYQLDTSIRHHCSVVGGMSGSPMISFKSNQVVAIVNTAVNDEALTQPECSLNRPCELSNDGKVATFPKENYAQRVNNVLSCFDQKGIFNLNLSSCNLEKP